MPKGLRDEKGNTEQYYGWTKYKEVAISTVVLDGTNEEVFFEELFNGVHKKGNDKTLDWCLGRLGNPFQVVVDLEEYLRWFHGHVYSINGL